jgi:hypothetical protein
MDTAPEFIALLTCGVWDKVLAERQPESFRGWNQSVNLLTKIAIVLLCFALCGAGTFIASTAQNEDRPQKTNVIPVKNREVVRRVWIQV